MLGAEGTLVAGAEGGGVLNDARDTDKDGVADTPDGMALA